MRRARARPVAVVTSILRQNGWTFGLLALLAALLLFAKLVQPRYGEISIQGLGTSVLPLAIAAVAQAVVVIAGGIDLSIGSMMALTSVVAASAMHRQSEEFGIAVVIGVLALGLVLGAVNGALVVATRVPDIVVTLAMSFVWAGCALIVRAAPGGGAANWLKDLAVGPLGSEWVPKATVVMLVVVSVIWIPVARSRLGLSMYALGSNSLAAFRSGVPVGRTKWAAYVLCGLFAALAGLSLTASTGIGTPVPGPYTLESVAAVRFPRAPLSGFLDFAASGSASFQSPRYGGQVRITDLFISDEGIGQVTGRVDVRERLMSLELEAGSPRLAVSGTGRIMLTPGMDAELTFRFTDTSLDPYVRVVEPRLSPFTRAVVSGTLRVVGQLANVDRLLVDGTVEQLDASLFDYKVRNDGPIRLALDRNVVRIERLRLAGTNTRLDVGGTVSLHNERIAVTAVGDANLGILQGFYRDIRSSGRAELKGEIQGPLRTPLFSGSAVITDGRIRYMGLPHSVEAINGRITFRGGGIRFDDVAATVATGKVHFGGGLEMNGYVPGQLAITATGEDMHLRYPEGFRSIVDADLALVGTFSSPTLRGTVTVKSATWSRRIDVSAGLLVGVRSSTTAPVTAAGETVPLRFDIRIQARGTLRIQNNVADIVSSADLTLRGTYEHPLLFGRAEIDRGIATFEGRRYVVTHGTVDFTNPTRIEPFFDIGAETRVRGLGQTYVVDLRIIGTISRLDPQLSSDPPLPPVDILSLLFSNATQMQDVELRALQKPNAAEQQLLGTRAAALLTSPISSGVSRAVEQTFGLDTFQITPSLGTDPYQRLEAGARVTIGKRISDKAYLTYARSLITARDYVVLLEYDQSDRLSWIMSRNEDGTYALDVRVRHTF